MSEQTGLNYQGILDNQQKIGELEDRIKKLEEYYIKDTELFKSLKEIVGSILHILDHLHQLEKKERARAMADHNREVSLD